jgi:lipid-A-disaccharide synthase-like uncharacterized protein
MNEVIGHLFGVVLTPWKLVGYLGVSLFAGRWVVQLVAARRSRRPVVPRLFWSMSIAGSALLLAYFTFGRNDSVGVLSNLFPMAVALYNWSLDVRAARRDEVGGPGHPRPTG